MGAITTLLEELVLSGRANWRTYCTGGSGVASIPMSGNSKYMVVTGFIWNPFNDSDVVGQNEIFRLINKNIHTLMLDNGKKKFFWDFRDSFFKNTTPDLAVQDNIPNFAPPTFYPAYVTSKNEIKINIRKFSDPNQTLWNSDTIPLSTEEDPSPNGYGGQAQIRSIDTSNGVSISEMGLFRDPNSLLPNLDRQKNEFVDDLSALALDSNLLNSPATLGDGRINSFSFPIITFYVVDINEEPSQYQR